jgi:hypothetical protein
MLSMPDLFTDLPSRLFLDFHRVFSRNDLFTVWSCGQFVRHFSVVIYPSLGWSKVPET